jgi:hypothetical protein
MWLRKLLDLFNFDFSIASLVLLLELELVYLLLQTLHLANQRLYQVRTISEVFVLDRADVWKLVFFEAPKLVRLALLAWRTSIWGS